MAGHKVYPELISGVDYKQQAIGTAYLTMCMSLGKGFRGCGGWDTCASNMLHSSTIFDVIRVIPDDKPSFTSRSNVYRWEKLKVYVHSIVQCVLLQGQASLVNIKHIIYSSLVHTRIYIHLRTCVCENNAPRLECVCARVYIHTHIAHPPALCGGIT